MVMSVPSAVLVSGLRLTVPGRDLFRAAELSVPNGDTVAIMGPSGSGKTTFLNCLAGIVPVAAGTVNVAGEDLFKLSSSKRARHRLKQIGMLFQFGELLHELTVIENIALPLKLLGEKRRSALHAAATMLAKLEIANLAGEFPDTLSGGETQRAALARALVTNPSVLLADEPTGALDERSGSNVMDLLLEAASHRGTAVVVATHDVSIARRASKVFEVAGFDLVSAKEEPASARAADV